MQLLLFVCAIGATMVTTSRLYNEEVFCFRQAIKIQQFHLYP